MADNTGAPANTRLGAVVGQGDAQPFGGEPIPLAVRNPLDQPPQTAAGAGRRSSVRRCSRRTTSHAAGATASRAARGCGIPAGSRSKRSTRGKQRLHPRVAEAQCRGALTVDVRRTVEIIERFGSNGAVVAEFLDAEQASVGSKADLFQIIEVLQPAADIEVVRVVDDRLGAQRAAPPCGTALMRECL